MARAEGIKAGLLQLLTLWPFPEKTVREMGVKAGKLMVIEDSQGQLVEDVKNTLHGEAPVHLLGIWGRHDPGPGGVIHPERIVEEVKSIL